MIQVLPVKDNERLRSLYESAAAEFSEKSAAVEASCNGEALGFCLYELDGRCMTVTRLVPTEDIMLADGILRSALHAGAVAGAIEAFYAPSAPEALFRRLGFAEEGSNALRLDKLFESCCGCK